MLRRWAPTLLLAFPAVAATDFARDIFPVFSKRCAGCHGEKAQMGRLRLDARALFQAGGQSGRAVEPGSADRSLLIARISGDTKGPQMPPAGPKLTAAEIASIRTWIDEGAVWPDGVGSAAHEIRQHWSYRKPARPSEPAVRTTAWPRTAIDRFVLARIESAGLTPSPRADKATLLRRLSLDLTGLPPTLAELDAFLADTTPGAWEKQVDRLLASPHYGERWAQWWLDLARYADTNGYESDEPRSMWPWRDWVIRAFNRNLPFDQFTIEQLAGDLLPNATLDQRIATGFHRNTLINSEAGSKDDEYRDAAVKDRVETTGTVWMASTIGCAQCHNHKYDPFTQRDFYNLYAIFNNTAESAISITEEIRVFHGDRAELDRRKSRIEQLDAALEAPSLEIDAARPVWIASLRSRLPAIDTSWRELGKPDTAMAELRLDAPASALRLSAKVDVTAVEAWTESDLAAQKRLEADQPEWGVWHQSAIFEAPSADEAHRTAYAPEAAVDLSSGWKKRPDLPDASFYQLDGYNCSTYLYRTVTAKQAQKIRVAVGSAQGVRVWLNGAIVKSTAALEELPPEKGEIDLDLKPGVNHLLLKYTNGPGYYRYYFRQFVGLERRVKPEALSPDGRELLFAEPLPAGVLRIRFARKPSDLTVSASGLPAADLRDWTAAPESVREAIRQGSESAELVRHYRRQAPTRASLRADYAGARGQHDTYYAENSAPTMVLRELDQPRETFIQARGNFLTKVEPVAGGVPAILPQLPASTRPDRLSLARWLVSPDHPLTARVTANHLWRALFSQGLVKTGEDFGSQGDPPTHPELLDWLATELIAQNWNLKAFLKTICMSEFYMQSSKASAPLLERDPENKLYARASRFRLPAESVRDITLSAAGLLSPKVGGPSVYPPLPPSVFEGLFIEAGLQAWPTSQGDDRYRRGLYTFIKRTGLYPTFQTFDAPDRSVCTVSRPRSNTPLQALTTLNDEAFVEAAQALAAIMKREPGIREGLALGFRRATGRRPDATEARALQALFDRTAARPGASPALAWTVAANVILNLDETVTRE